MSDIARRDPCATCPFRHTNLVGGYAESQEPYLFIDDTRCTWVIGETQYGTPLLCHEDLLDDTERWCAGHVAVIAATVIHAMPAHVQAANDQLRPNADVLTDRETWRALHGAGSATHE